MIQEVVILNIIPEKNAVFLKDFKKASLFISKIEGYIKHSLSQCLEDENKYFLYVEWKTLKSHTVNFRESGNYQSWKALLHKYYDPFPEVAHYRMVFQSKF